MFHQEDATFEIFDEMKSKAQNLKLFTFDKWLVRSK